MRLVLATAAALLVAAAPASASTLVTWDSASAFVDPATAPFNPTTSGRPRTSPLPINVLLPDGYDPHRAYPVLYLLHGHGDAYDSWADPKHGDVARIAAGLRAIVVMPEGGRGWYTNWWHGGARSPGWERYYLEELVPLVERRVKIAPGRSNHAIAGLSMGGEGAAYLAEELPGYFGSVAIFSGVLSLQRPEWPAGMSTQGEQSSDVFGDPDAQRFYWTGHNPTALAGNLRWTRVFVTVGDGTPGSPSEATNTFGEVAEAELRQHAQDFVAAAQHDGVDVTYLPRQGIHDWPYWRAGLAGALRWGFFKDVRDTPSRWSYETVSQHGRAWDMRYDFDRPPDTVIDFERDGHRISATGAGTVTLRFDKRRGTLRLALPFRDRALPKPARAKRSRPSARSGHAPSRRRRRAP
jgi:S-formylglutathione hydrolase FrmB